jgi:hypothetical protein
MWGEVMWGEVMRGEGMRQAGGGRWGKDELRQVWLMQTYVVTYVVTFVVTLACLPARVLGRHAATGGGNMRQQ